MSRYCCGSKVSKYVTIPRNHSSRQGAQARGRRVLQVRNDTCPQCVETADLLDCFVQCRVLLRGLAVAPRALLLLGPHLLVADRHVHHPRSLELIYILNSWFSQNDEIAQQRVLIASAEVAVAILTTPHWTWYQNIGT